MSTLSNDQKKAVTRKPMEGIEAPLRDQVVQKLLDKLNDERLGEKLCQIWEVENSNRGLMLERQQLYLASWDNFVPEEVAGPFEGSSNLHLPVTFTACKTLHARMFQAILGVDPPFTMKPRRADSVEATDVVDQLMTYAIKEWVNEGKGLEDVVDGWLWDWITTGTGILKAGWDVKHEKFIDVVKIPYQSQQIVEVPGGQRVPVPVTRFREKEKEVVIERFRGPRVEHVRLEDYIQVGGGGDPSKSDIVMHRDYLTAGQIWHLVDQKRFNSETADEVIKSGKNYKSTGISNAIKTVRAMAAGKGTLDTESELDRYEVLECFVSHDVDGDGITSELVVWVHKQSGRILGATYLRRLSRAGERPFSVIHFHRRPGEDYGMGLVEIMFPLAQEIDAQHNMRVDYGLLSNMPYFFYRPSSNVDAVKEELAPGKGIPLDNPQTDVYFPPMSNRTAYGFMEEQNLTLYSQRLTGLSDMTMGMMTGDQGATRTATGARALVGESNANLDIHLRRLNRGWDTLLSLMLHIIQQRIPEGFAFRVTGQDGNNYFAKIFDRDDIAGDWDFEISPNTANSNRAITQQVAQNIVAITSNPIDYQLGILTPASRFEALRNQLQSLGVKDWSKFIQKPKNQTFQMTAAEEVNRVLRGQEVPITIDGDHVGFIKYWDYIKSTDELLVQFTQDQVAAVEAHAQKHNQMFEAVRQMAAQQANVAQARQNSENSQAVTAPPAAGNVGPNG